MDHQHFFNCYFAGNETRTGSLYGNILSCKVTEVRHILTSSPYTQKFLKTTNNYGKDQLTSWDQSWAPVQLAALLSQYPIIKVLVLEFGANVNSRQVFGRRKGVVPGSWTALSMAVYQQDLKCVEALLEVGADETKGGTIKKGFHFDSALELAEILSYDVIAEKLREWKNIRKLSDAIEEGHCSVIQEALNNNPHLLLMVGPRCLTPLQHATLLGKNDVIKLLVQEFECPVDSVRTQLCGFLRGSWTCLHLAVKMKSVHTVMRLIDFGANPMLGGAIGEMAFSSAIDLAQKINFPDILRVLDQADSSVVDVVEKKLGEKNALELELHAALQIQEKIDESNQQFSIQRQEICDKQQEIRDKIQDLKEALDFTDKSLHQLKFCHTEKICRLEKCPNFRDDIKIWSIKKKLGVIDGLINTFNAAIES